MSHLDIIPSLFPPIITQPGMGDSVGVSVLIYNFVVFLPLVLLFATGLFVGAIFGARAGGMRGAMVRGMGGAFLGGVIYVIGYNILRAQSDQRAKEESVRRAYHAEAIAACIPALSEVHNEYAVDSVVLKSGVVDHQALISLLGDQGLMFIELETGALPPIQGKSDSRWGIKTDDGAEFLVDQDVVFIRFSVGIDDEVLCDRRATMIFNLNRPLGPLPPGVCIRVERVSTSLATHAIQLRKKADSKFQHWTLVEQVTGTPLFALATDDSITTQTRWGSREEEGVKQVRFGKLSCHDPYFSMLNTLYRPAESDPGRPIDVVK